MQVPVEQVASSIAAIRYGGPARIAGVLTPSSDDIAGAGATTSRTCQVHERAKQAERKRITENILRSLRVKIREARHRTLSFHLR